jgi:hypothetical protein
VRWLAAALLLLVGGVAAAGVPRAPVEHDLTVRIDPATRELVGEDRLLLPPSGPVTLALAARFTVERIVLDGRPLAEAGRVDRGRRLWRLPASDAARRVEIRWRGTLAPLDEALDHKQVLTRREPVTGARGTFLPAASAWYPQVAGAHERYRLALDLPAGQKGLVPGRLVAEEERDGRYRARFEFPHPGDGIDLMAGPYVVAERRLALPGGRTVALRTWLHPEVAELAGGYLDATAGYLELYDRWIGPYPFTEFSVVSSPTPTGFGMPALTYLGIDVLRLPFIRATSLGHEVLHNWWGNGVYADYARGNWSEGLTTFMADYFYKERESPAAAREQRLAWLRDFAAIPAGEDRPLAEFVSRTHGTSRIVGYDKAAMLFLMLRDAIGREAFDRGVQRFWREQRFREASWDDLRGAFEAEAGRSLQGFFAQWLTRPGAPQLTVAAVRRSGDAARGQVEVTLEQGEAPYALRVPLLVRTAGGEETHVVELTAPRQTFLIATQARAVAVALDPELRLFRRLASGEAPPILRQVTLDAATETVVLADGRAAAAGRELAAKLLEHPLRLRAGDASPGRQPLLVVGTTERVAEWLARHRLPGPPAEVAGPGTAQVWIAQTSAGQVLAVVAGRDAEALAALARPLPHYGRQSWLVFDGAKALARGVWPSRPVEVRLDQN